MSRVPGPDQGAVPRRHARPAAAWRRPAGLAVSLLVAHMLSLRRATALVRAIPGLNLSEATCLGCVRRLHDAPGPWEEAAVARLPEAPALHADETGFRIGGRTRRLHVLSDGGPALRFLHRRRGREAVEETGVIPRYAGTPVHDCWKACLACTGCRHQLCGSHLLREPAFIVDSNGLRRARLMKKLLRRACRRVSTSPARTLAEDLRGTVRARHRAILEHGLGELPGIPPRPKGGRGRIAKSDAHDLCMNASSGTRTPSCAS